MTQLDESRLDEAGDAELMRLAADGDEEAFVAIYRRRHGAIHRFALRMSGSPTVAEDVTQEVFLTLIGKIAEYDPARGALAAYLLGIARVHLSRHFARSRPQIAISEDPVDVVPAALI